MKPQHAIALVVLSLVALGAAIAVTLRGMNADNRTPTAAEMKKANETRFKYIDTLPLPPEEKKVMMSHMGGPAYSDPRIAAAIAAAKAKGAKIKPTDRQQ